MRIAVATLTRDRLRYTEHCFQTLRDNAGCDFDHFIVDQGSVDGTAEWLLAQEDLTVMTLSENVGICRGLNLLLDEALDASQYDVIVRFDNDCEVLQHGTLQALAEFVYAFHRIAAPRVRGLRNPPAVIEHGPVFDDTEILGGIFMGIPSDLFHCDGFRYDETQPPWTGDELICPWFRARGGRCGYLTGFEVNHYLTTDGQVDDIPEYFERRVLEGGPAR